ncbi:hypothetical protein CO046_03615 [Candidatus Peregrinibacteria bacterium CG_4_9_14_0_2_um_filter_53_11]|nr:MAG: hypothetical protein CO046_03615 [Candidatus Peregrinibacteria bacterium CG_4_9_14_0_2_um_filter_53_11]
MSKLSQSVLDKIKKEQIAPRARWQFVVLHCAVWTLLLLSVITGSLAMSVVFRDLFGTEWEFAEYVAGSRLRGIIIMLPYIWFATTALGIFLAYKLFEKTRHGYRYRAWVIAGGTVALSGLTGLIFFAAGTADSFEHGIRQTIPQYARLREAVEGQWVAPEKGILVGRVKELTNEEMLLVDDLAGKEWEVERVGQALELPFELRVEMMLLMRGEAVEDDEFQASQLRPWRRGEPLRKPGRPGPGAEGPGAFERGTPPPPNARVLNRQGPGAFAPNTPPPDGEAFNREGPGAPELVPQPAPPMR